MTTTAGSLASALILALAFLIVSRGLGPEKFGVLSVAVTLVILSSKLLDLGMSQTMVKFLGNWHRSVTTAESISRQVLYWRLRIALFAGVPLGLIVAYVLRGSDLSSMPTITLVLIGTIGTTLLDHICVYFTAQHRFRFVASALVFQSSAKLLGFLLLWWNGLGTPLTYLAVFCGIPVLVAGVLLVLTREARLLLPRRAPQDIQERLFHFTRHSALSALGMAVVFQADVLLVHLATDTYQAGLYAGAARVASLVALLTTSVASVLNNRAARYQDWTVQRQYLRKSWVVVLGAAVLFGGVFVGLDPVYGGILGPDYLAGKTAALLLILNACLGLAVTPFIAFFYGTQRQVFFSGGSVLQAMIVVLGSVLLVPQWGITGVAISRVAATLSFLIWVAIFLSHFWQETRYSSRNKLLQ